MVPAAPSFRQSLPEARIARFPRRCKRTDRCLRPARRTKSPSLRFMIIHSRILEFIIAHVSLSGLEDASQEIMGSPAAGANEQLEEPQAPTHKRKPSLCLYLCMQSLRLCHIDTHRPEKLKNEKQIGDDCGATICHAVTYTFNTNHPESEPVLLELELPLEVLLFASLS